MPRDSESSVIQLQARARRCGCDQRGAGSGGGVSSCAAEEAGDATRRGGSLRRARVADRQALAAFGTPTRYDGAAVARCHAGAVAVLVGTLAAAWLVRPFHFRLKVLIVIRGELPLIGSCVAAFPKSGRERYVKFCRKLSRSLTFAENTPNLLICLRE